MFPEAEERRQHQQVPQALIEEGWMHIDIVCPLRNMGRNVLGNIPGPHRLDGELHGKQAVIILTEDFSVHEVPPAADGLSQNQARHAGVSHQQRIFLFYPAIDEQSDERGYHPAVDGHTAIPGIEYAQQIILVIIPGEHHIVDAGPDDGEDDGINGEIPVVVRILPRHLGHVRRHEDARQHADADDQAIVGNAEAKDAEGLGHVPQVDSQVRERDISWIHKALPFRLLPYLSRSAEPTKLRYIRYPYTLKRNKITSPSFTT